MKEKNNGREKRVTVKIGDVFAIRLNQGRYCYGQVVSEGRISDCMIVYDLVSMEHPKVSEITSKPIISLILKMSPNWSLGHLLV
ncbi:Imm26 family immunity protein [Paenibacillus xylanivorans]|uniref:Imm26 family immunity protein n=1 Tax=Paenibacillus xylanivorans TaxID=1705561 RepID=UPI001364D528